MAVVGDRVQVPSKRVGQLPREGVVTGVSGGLLRVKWSGGEESTITPSMGSLMVVGRVKAVAKKGVAPAKTPPRKAGKALVKKTAKTAKTSVKQSAKRSSKTSSKRSGGHKRSR